MTIWNEAVRLFFAVSALILVGMLSAPVGGIALAPEKTREISFAEPKKVELPAKSKNAIKISDRKAARKNIIAKKG